MRSSPPPLQLLLVFFSVGLSQSHLVYPPPTDVTPTKVQLIFGLGIPMEIEASTIVGYVMKANYNLPYNSTVLTNPYVRYQKRSIEKSSTTSRYDLYKMLEGSAPAKQGKACLLRCICELAATPLRDRRSSILAQLVHVLFTPSSTRDSAAEADDWIEWSDQEYRAAELLGRRHKGSVDVDVCSRNFAECQISILSYFTDYYRDHYDDAEEEQEISD